MLSKSLAAVSALALVLGSSAAAAQTSVAPVGAPVAQGEAGDLSGRGTGIYIIGAIVIGLLIWGGIELLGNDDEEATSP